MLTRHTWEQDNADKITQMSDEVISAFNLTDGECKLIELKRFVGERSLTDPELTQAMARAETAVGALRERAVAEQNRREESRRHVEEEEKRQREDSQRNKESKARLHVVAGEAYLETKGRHIIPIRDTEIRLLPHDPLQKAYEPVRSQYVRLMKLNASMAELKQNEEYYTQIGQPAEWFSKFSNLDSEHTKAMQELIKLMDEAKKASEVAALAGVAKNDEYITKQRFLSSTDREGNFTFREVPSGRYYVQLHSKYLTQHICWLVVIECPFEGKVRLTINNAFIW